MKRLFRDRRDAGEWLARSLKKCDHGTDVAVLALSRGGVPVAFEVAHALNLPLVILMPRALTAPQGVSVVAVASAASSNRTRSDHV